VPALAPTVAAAAGKPTPVIHALQRLQEAQNRDGGFGRRLGDKSDPATSVWATLAMVSLGIHPDDQPRTNTSAYEYLVGDGTAEAPGIQNKLQDSSDLAAFMLVMQAIGARDLGVGAGTRLVARQDGTGGIAERKGGTPTTQATALATLALRSDPVHSSASGNTFGWLKRAFSVGGWGATAGASPRPDTTGIAVVALMAVDPRDEDQLASKAQAYLAKAANADGGFGGERPKPSEPRATAWAMLGLEAVGYPARRFNNGGEGVSTATYLAKHQQDDGGFGDTVTTAQIIPGFNASGLTFEKVVEKGGSDLISRHGGGERHRNEAATGGKGDPEAGEGAKAGNDGDGRKGGSQGTPSDDGADDTPGDGTPGGGSSDDAPAGNTTGGGTPPASLPSTPAPVPSTPAPAPTATTPKPADDTVASAAGDDDEQDDEPPADAATQQVNGVVVGAQAAAASTAPGLAAGGGDAGDRGTAVLGGLIVALVLVGTQLERRRPKRIVS
jgi:hypothetical protein